MLVECVGHCFCGAVPRVFRFRFVASSLLSRARALSRFPFRCSSPGVPRPSRLSLPHTRAKHFRRPALCYDFWTLGKERIVEDNVTRIQCRTHVQNFLWRAKAIAVDEYGARAHTHTLGPHHIQTRPEMFPQALSERAACDHAILRQMGQSHGRPHSRIACEIGWPRCGPCIRSYGRTIPSHMRVASAARKLCGAFFACTATPGRGHALECGQSACPSQWAGFSAAFD